MTNEPLHGLKRIRERQHVTQSELASAIDATQSQLNKFEKGLVRLDIYRARTLSLRLGCTIEDLL